MQENKDRLRKYLQEIDVKRLDYSDWIKVGMAMKQEGFTASEWEEWSSNDPRHKAGECFIKWDTFEGDGFGTVTGGTIVQMAKDMGYKPVYNENIRVLGWNDIISQEVPDDVVLKSEPPKLKLVEPGDNWEGYKDTIKYLETLFNPDEYVGYVMQSTRTDEGKFYPRNKGIYTRTAVALIDELKRYNGRMDSALGTYNEDAGAWVRINPLNGEGVKNIDVADYRYALIESDDMDIEDQVAFMEEMRLPIATMVYSGGKSIHALVKIKAQSYKEYKTKVNYLYEVCDKNGFAIDKQNRNPSRLSRLPGVYREGKKQWLIATDTGFATFDEWRDWIEEVNDDLGDPEGPPEDGERPQLADELIQGILREGHKMMIAGPSKAGKSFLLLELGIAIARGGDWLGKKCKKGKVMYVNLELDAKSAWVRVYDILDQAGLKYEDLGDNFLMWNLRGKSAPMDRLAPKLIRRAEKEDYSAIIIDPIYKVLTGDENNARDMANFTNQFDKIATSLGCAVIYCHHHSKGYQGQKKSMDRASGSGVFARDPDALLDMTELVCETQEDRDKYGFKAPKETAWRIEGTLREFESPDPMDIYFSYPVHRRDEDGVLRDLKPESEYTRYERQERGKSNTRQSKKEKQKNDFKFKFANYTSFNKTDCMPIEEMAKSFGVQSQTIYNWIRTYDDYKVVKANIYEA